MNIYILLFLAFIGILLLAFISEALSDIYRKLLVEDQYSMDYEKPEDKPNKEESLDEKIDNKVDQNIREINQGIKKIIRDELAIHQQNQNEWFKRKIQEEKENLRTITQKETPSSFHYSKKLQQLVDVPSKRTEESIIMVSKGEKIQTYEAEMDRMKSEIIKSIIGLQSKQFFIRSNRATINYPSFLPNQQILYFLFLLEKDPDYFAKIKKDLEQQIEKREK
jgi:hypothetical protein